MQTDRSFPIAGPTDHPQEGSAARNARTMSLLRDRVSRAAATALPPHRRRPAKGRGRWPGRIPLDSI